MDDGNDDGNERIVTQHKHAQMHTLQTYYTHLHTHRLLFDKNICIGIIMTPTVTMHTNNTQRISGAIAKTLNCPST